MAVGVLYMMSTGESGAVMDDVEEIAGTIAGNTRLSEKQAMALVMKEVSDKSNQEIAEALDVGSPASASSYVTRCRSKFNAVDGEISGLEQEIEKWEKTRHLSRFLGSVGTTSLSELVDWVETEIVDDDCRYLVSYEDGSGVEQVETFDKHPRDLDVDVVSYRRINSVDEVF